MIKIDELDFSNYKSCYNKYRMVNEMYVIIFRYQDYVPGYTHASIIHVIIAVYIIIYVKTQFES